MFRQWLAVLLVVLLVSGLGAGEGNITCQGGDRTHRSDWCVVLIIDIEYR